jgi:hypothetical protein
MKPSLTDCKRLAESIAVDFFEADIDGNLEEMIELATTKIADKLYESERTLLTAAHLAYIEAIKREGER